MQRPASGALLRAALKRCLRRLPPRDLLARLSEAERKLIDESWELTARDDQLPPDFFDPLARWRTWLFMAGRGAGKTRAGAEWILREVRRAARPLRIALVAPSLHDARSVMVEGISGILAVSRPGERPLFEPSRRLLSWPGGSRAQLFSAEEPDSLRGPQFHLAWCDEIARWPRGAEVWDMLMFALRLGDMPRVLATTTPAPVPLVRGLASDPRVWLSRAATSDNAANLSGDFIAAMRDQYGGTRLGRQELEGELIDDDPDALFRRPLIEQARVGKAPALARVVVAIDPSATSHGDACGIVVAGRGEDDHFYVLEDASLQKATPAAWARAAVACYHRRRADRVVAEVNQGGEMVEAVLRQVDPAIPFRALRASRGKQVRAEPVAALYEQGRVHHVGALPLLEDELCAFEQLMAAGKSPDRADALVWAISELARPTAAPRVRVV